MLGAAVFAYTSGPNFWLLLFGATIGVISPSGKPRKSCLHACSEVQKVENVADACKGVL